MTAVIAGIVERILDAEVSAADMARALEAINALPPEHRADIGARAMCLMGLFAHRGPPGINLRIAAIDWRFQALARLANRPEFKNWSLPGRDGATNIAITVLEAAASEPLIEIDGRPGFDADTFFTRLLSLTEEEGHG